MSPSTTFHFLSVEDGSRKPEKAEEKKVGTYTSVFEGMSGKWAKYSDMSANWVYLFKNSNRPRNRKSESKTGQFKLPLAEKNVG